MGLLKKQKFPLLLGPRNRNDMRENNRNDKRNFERRDGKKRDFKGKRDYRDRDRKQEVQQADEEFTGGMVEGRNAEIKSLLGNPFRVWYQGQYIETGNLEKGKTWKWNS